ncbi:hypothetical protein CDL12_04431 [Handroanthus impetiginosus]|uniref:DUF4378 domain-containing protein n=1 Tax=Handroanthus impetiginosus TaxID=429701 RepID=A0A2G9HZ97_9LAMI|nr:hypothetical protein CDL12_04431 [Handroanthus impetiginosus]
MAKRSQRRPSRHERDQAGCIWGLISMFDFRHGRSTRRLLADRRRVNKQAAGAGHLKTGTTVPGPAQKYEDLLDVDESKMRMTDVAKTSVKELMEEEMFNEQGSRNQMIDSEMDLEQINAKNENHKRNRKRRNKSCNKSRDMDVSELDAADHLIDDQVLEQKPSDDLALETIMEELAKIYQRSTSCLKHDFHCDVNIPSGQAVAKEKLVAAVKLFVEQKLSSSKRFGEDDNSKELMNALKTLNLNNGSFLKLLEDPNLELLKHIRDLEDVRQDKDQPPNSLPASYMSQEKPLILKPDELSSRKPRNFFRRRSKSMESYPLGGDKDYQSPNKIVILKPGLGGAQSPDTVTGPSLMDNKVDHERNTSQFSFTEIKRKLRHAMGKERQGVSPDRPILKLLPKHGKGNNVDKGCNGENFGWSSPNRNHFYTEKFTASSPSFKKGEPVVKLKDKGSTLVKENCQYPRLGGSNIYVEAKKHLSEMLKNGDENVSLTGQLPKSLGRILSFPEYNGSPCCSPRKYSDDIFITSPMRLSPRSIVKSNVSGILQENNNNLVSPRRQNLESQPCVSGGSSEDKEQSLNTNIDIPLKDDREHSLQAQSSAGDTIVHEVQSSSSIVAETESRPLEEEKIIDVSSESSSDSTGGDIQTGDTREVESKESASQFLKEPSPCCKLDILVEDQILSPPTMSPSRGEIKDSNRTTDKAERPSPISVLEPLFTDDDISPPGTISQPVEKDIQPRHIHFEEQSPPGDQGICTRISLEGEESAFEYVEAVLLGSGLNWDEFLLRWLSMYEILDSSLFEEVELFSSRPHHDQKLLFDCANEALHKVCESYFGCFTGISNGKPNTRTIPKGMDLINEIWKRVEWHLFQQSQPHALDQLIRKDLSSPGKWMNLEPDIELIGFEMEETIFNEMVEDIVLSFVESTSECEFAVLQAEPEAIDNANL